MPSAYGMCAVPPALCTATLVTLERQGLITNPFCSCTGRVLLCQRLVMHSCLQKFACLSCCCCDCMQGCPTKSSIAILAELYNLVLCKCATSSCNHGTMHGTAMSHKTKCCLLFACLNLFVQNNCWLGHSCLTLCGTDNIICYYDSGVARFISRNLWQEDVLSLQVDLSLRSCHCTAPRLAGEVLMQQLWPTLLLVAKACGSALLLTHCSLAFHQGCMMCRTGMPRKQGCMGMQDYQQRKHWIRASSNCHLWSIPAVLYEQADLNIQ